MKRRRLGILLVLLAGVVLGALREFVFLNLNYQIDFVQYDRRVSYAHSLFQGWVGGADLDTLLVIKWTMAGMFVLVMACLSVLLAAVLWGHHRYRNAIMWGFALMSTVVLVLQLLGSKFPALGTVSVQVLHGLQYPVVLFFLVAASALAPSRSN